MVATSPPPPQIWPKECAQLYSPVRVIGRGGFAEVWMAKRKGANSSDGDTQVAVKVVGKDLYSRREVTILSELSKTPHPNIVRLLDDFKSEEDGGHHIVVMSLHRGPTLKYILEKGGALGLKIAQCISKQLIDAVAYLHGHAVIHRDIQPANLVISGAKLDDDLWWNSDEFDIDGKVLAHTKKCHVTLIDFGFAKALAKEDITENAIASNDGTAVTSTDESDKTSRGRSRTRDDSISCSRRKMRGQTPLGTRSYAAPEMFTTIRKVTQSISSSIHRRRTKQKSESECISDYGMVADAYSVGTTISHLVTGIPPNIDADEFVASKNHPLKKLSRNIKKCFSDKSTKRAKKYRLRSDLPLDINEVIRLLTHFDERRRSTVREARHLPWIKGNLEDADIGESADVQSFMDSGGPMVFLTTI